MEELFKTKIRRIGTSFGVLIPGKVIKRENLKDGEEVEIALLKRRRLVLIEKAFGLTSGAKGFRRDDIDRVL
jgi:antitoxin component of MazEF toxin-antitoxin module